MTETKRYTAGMRTRAAQARSRRMREAGETPRGRVGGGVVVTGGGGGSVEGHSHNRSVERSVGKDG